MPDCDLCDIRSDDYEWSSNYRLPHWDKKKVAGMLSGNWEIPVFADLCAVLEGERSLEERFYEQANKWQTETGHFSSPSQRIMHPSYQAILGMGREHKLDIIRLLIRDLQQNRRAWFWALSYLAQDNPINPEDAGKIDKMIFAWVKWGKTKGIL
jgi:hypothetical protein